MKILIYKHSSVKTKIDDDIAKIVPYFNSDFVQQFLDIDISIKVEKTKLPMKDVPLNLFYKNEGKYDIVMYIFEKGKFNLGSQGLASMLSPKLVGIYCAVDKISDDIDYNWKCFVHEILHAICFLTSSSIPNLLDNSVPTKYYKNDEPFSSDGNFAQQLLALKNYMIKPIVIINRISDDGTQTLGNLMYDNFKCKTLELSYKNNKPNISCIPKGLYNCKYTFSPKFMKYTYEVQNVYGRSGIRIHSGNYFFDIQGCILLGDGYSDINKDGKVDIINSRKTIEEFRKILMNREFTLVIK